MKTVTARQEYQCADCPKPIRPGDRCVNINEYGEKRRLHATCAQKRASRHQEKP